MGFLTLHARLVQLAPAGVFLSCRHPDVTVPAVEAHRLLFFLLLVLLLAWAFRPADLSVSPHYCLLLFLIHHPSPSCGLRSISEGGMGQPSWRKPPFSVTGRPRPSSIFKVILTALPPAGMISPHTRQGRGFGSFSTVSSSMEETCFFIVSSFVVTTLSIPQSYRPCNSFLSLRRVR